MTGIFNVPDIAIPDIEISIPVPQVSKHSFANLLLVQAGGRMPWHATVFNSCYMVTCELEYLDGIWIPGTRRVLSCWYSSTLHEYRYVWRWYQDWGWDWLVEAQIH